MMEGGSLEDFELCIEAKLGVLRDAASRSSVAMPEVEGARRDAGRLLSEYESAIEKAWRLRHLQGTDDATLSQHEANHRRLLGALHQCILEARAAANRPVSRRAELLRRRAVPSGGEGARTGTAGATPADSLAQDISDSLREMASTMQEELLRSETSYSILQASSKRMAATGAQYQSLGGVLGSSARLIRELWRRERSDRWLIFVALAIYGLVLLYIASRRLWLLSLLLPAAKGAAGGVWAVWTLLCGMVWRLTGLSRGPLADKAGTMVAQSQVIMMSSWPAMSADPGQGGKADGSYWSDQPAAPPTVTGESIYSGESLSRDTGASSNAGDEGEL